MPKMLEITSILQYEETRNNKVMKERKKERKAINISRKKRVTKFVFCMLLNIKIIWKFMLSFLLGLTRHVQST